MPLCLMLWRRRRNRGGGDLKEQIGGNGPDLAVPATSGVVRTRFKEACFSQEVGGLLISFEKWL